MTSTSNWSSAIRVRLAARVCSENVKTADGNRCALGNTGAIREGSADACCLRVTRSLVTLDTHPQLVLIAQESFHDHEGLSLPDKDPSRSWSSQDPRPAPRAGQAKRGGDPPWWRGPAAAYLVGQPGPVVDMGKPCPGRVDRFGSHRHTRPGGTFPGSAWRRGDPAAFLELDHVALPDLDPVSVIAKTSPGRRTRCPAGALARLSLPSERGCAAGSAISSKICPAPAAISRVALTTRGASCSAVMPFIKGCP